MADSVAAAFRLADPLVTRRYAPLFAGALAAACFWWVPPLSACIGAYRDEMQRRVFPVPERTAQ